jgi:hypothetical protein
MIQKPRSTGAAHKANPLITLMTLVTTVQVAPSTHKIPTTVTHTTNSGGSMKKTGMLLSALLVMGAVAQAADVKFDGQIRYRMESSNNAFDSDIDAFNISALRTRLAASIAPQDGLNIYIQLQDSRRIGDSPTIADGESVDLHQAYFSYVCPKLDGVTLKMGRFEYAKADQRFFGSVGWSNEGRSFEGWQVNYDGMVNVDFYGFKIVENAAADADQTAWGFYFNNIMDKNIDVFYHMDDFGTINDDADVRSTFGIHYKNTYFDKLGVNFNYAMQMGTNESTDVDYAGSMMDFDLSYALDLDILNKVGFGYETMSGDDGSGDNTAWAELYPTGHKFHGYMDVVGGNDLNDLELNFFGKLPVGGFAYKLDYHMFSEVEGDGNDLGTEIDLTLKKSMGNYGVNFGYSLFTPEDDTFTPEGDTFAPGNDATSWMYMQFIANF